MYRSVLVPLDGSAFAEQALPLAASIAVHSQSVVRLVRVWEPPYRFVTELAPPELREEPDDRLASAVYLEHTADTLRSWGVSRIDTAVLSGDVAASIAKHAATTKTDIVVMTSHGRTGFRRAWLGSVADALVRSAAVPIVLRKPDESPGGATPEAVFRRILIPLDGSTDAEQVLPHAIELGRIFHASYVLLSVVRPVAMPVHHYAYAAAGAHADPTATEQAITRAERYLRARAERVAVHHDGAMVQVDVRLADGAGSAIVAAAREHAADLVALTTHVRRGVRLLLGSVADRILRGMDGGVLVLRATPE